MSTIVTRASKGSALTWAEGDANITNLNNDKLQNVVEDTTPQLGGNLDVNGQTITATSTNDITLEVTGSGGHINLRHGDPSSATASVTVGNGTNTGFIHSNAATTLALGADIANGAGPVFMELNADGNIYLSSRSAGSVRIQTNTVRVGNSNTNVTLGSNGTGSLTLKGNLDSTGAQLVLNQGTNSSIVLTPTGTGTVSTNGAFQAPVLSCFNSTYQSGSQFIMLQAHTTTDASNFTLARTRGNTTTMAAVQSGDELIDFNVAGNDGSATTTAGVKLAYGFTTTVTGTPITGYIPTRTDWNINNGAATYITYHSISTDGIARFREISTVSGTTHLNISAGTDGNISLAPNGTGRIEMLTDTTIFGDSNVNATITTNGTGDLILNTNNGVNSGVITILDGVDGDITFVPNGTGKVHFETSETRVGINNTNAKITTKGTGDLTLDTNSGSNSGTISIADGGGGYISITPEGSGRTVVKNLNSNESVYAYGNSGTLTWAPDLTSSTASNIVTMTLTGNLTFNGFTSPISGQTLTVILTQDGTGGKTLTSTMLFAGASKTLSTAANAVDILTVSYIGTTYYASLAKGFA